MIGVCIVTHNEEKYIRQCIESALSQRCSEPVCVYVGEDCSTDGTLRVCQEVASSAGGRIKIVHREQNYGLVRNTIELLRQIRSDGCEYVAMLDGDDYWIDELKLEKQVSFLKDHPDYGFVHTLIYRLHNDRYYEICRRRDVPCGYLFDDCRDIAVANCTAFFRTELLDCLDLDDFMRFSLKSVDYAMYNLLMKFTKFHFIYDYTAVWRRGHSSVSNRNDVEKQIAYLDNGVCCWRMENHYFPEKWPITDQAVASFVNTSAFEIAFKGGNYDLCRKYEKMLGEGGHALTYEGHKRFSVRNRTLFNLLSGIFRIKDFIKMIINHIDYLMTVKRQL